jgi:hypothetical protein
MSGESHVGPSNNAGGLINNLYKIIEIGSPNDGGGASSPAEDAKESPHASPHPAEPPATEPEGAPATEEEAGRAPPLAPADPSALAAPPAAEMTLEGDCSEASQSSSPQPAAPPMFSHGLAVRRRPPAARACTSASHHAPRARRR